MADTELWEQWVNDFKQASHSIPDISKNTRHSAIKQVLELIPVVVVFPGLIALVIYQTQGYPSLLGGFTITISAVILFLFFRGRMGAWKAEKETPRALLKLLKKQETARLKEIGPSQIILLIAAAVSTVHIPWKYLTGSQTNSIAEVAARLAVVYVIVFGTFVVIKLRKKKKEKAIKVIMELEKSFDNGE